MLDSYTHQASGLQRMALQNAPRVIAMASHGDQQGELPLLWSLCSALVDFGYSVAVLDATTCESSHNPGLAQLLHQRAQPVEYADEPWSWSVIPAACGLQQLCDATPTGYELAIDPLSEILQDFGVILIYARAPILVPLLQNSGVQPLLAVSSVKTSPVTAYQALKFMLLNAKLHPTVANIVIERTPKTTPANHIQVNNLQECAMAFLGYQLDSVTVHARACDMASSDDLHRLAMRLLENAMPLYRTAFAGGH